MDERDFVQIVKICLFFVKIRFPFSMQSEVHTKLHTVSIKTTDKKVDINAMCVSCLQDDRLHYFYENNVTVAQLKSLKWAYNMFLVLVACLSIYF